MNRRTLFAVLTAPLALLPWRRNYRKAEAPVGFDGGFPEGMTYLDPDDSHHNTIYREDDEGWHIIYDVTDEA